MTELNHIMALRPQSNRNAIFKTTQFQSFLRTTDQLAACKKHDQHQLLTSERDLCKSRLRKLRLVLPPRGRRLTKRRWLLELPDSQASEDWHCARNILLHPTQAWQDGVMEMFGVQMGFCVFFGGGVLNGHRHKRNDVYSFGLCQNCFISKDIYDTTCCTGTYFPIHHYWLEY